MKGGVERTDDRARFDYEKMKAAATSDNRSIRKRAFLEYFDRFQEFPSYLFDNESAIHPQLLETIQDIQGDSASSKALQAGIDTLLRRLPS